jgi:hypothetical protein
MRDAQFMPNAQELYEEMLQEVDAFLASEGFKRSGKCFRRRLPDGEVRWSIELQKSRHNKENEVGFTFWIHAEWKHRPASYEDWEPRSTWYGGAGGRIGYILPEKEDTWWKITTGTSPHFIADQLKAVLSSSGLPFLRQFETESDIKKYLREQSSSSMKHNYPHALSMLNLDILENKPPSEIEDSIKNARRLGRMNGVHKDVIEDAIQRVLNKRMEER